MKFETIVYINAKESKEPPYFNIKVKLGEEAILFSINEKDYPKQFKQLEDFWFTNNPPKLYEGDEGEDS